MVQTMTAIFDGKTFRPEGRVELRPNTKVRLAIEVPDTDPAQPLSFLETARGLELEGPEDWSERLEEYLYAPDAPRDG